MYRFGIVGCGAIAKRHAEIIARTERLLAVCDIKRNRVNEFSRQYHARGYASLSSMLAEENELDIVIICTPNGLHAEQSIQALNSGKHVLCEKPMALHVSDCREMIRVAKQHKKKLFVVKQNRYNPPVLLLKELLAKGKLGKIFSVHINCFWNRGNKYYTLSEWKGTKKMDGGVLFTQFSHFIDLAWWLFGDVKKVNAIIKNAGHKNITQIDDCGSVIIEFKNGVTGSLNYNTNAFNKNMEGSLTLFAEKGTFKIGGQYLNELEYFEVKHMKAPELPRSNTANQYGFYEGSMSNHHLVYKNMLAVLNGETKDYVSGEDGLKTVEIIEKIYKGNW